MATPCWLRKTTSEIYKAFNEYYDPSEERRKITGKDQERFGDNRFSDYMFLNTLYPPCERWLEKNADKPFFLYFATWLVHTPIMMHSEQLLRKYERKLGVEITEAHKQGWTKEGQTNPFYCAMVEQLDYYVGRLFDYLESTDDPRWPGHKLIENTYVIFTSDNGPHQEGGHKADFFDSNGRLRGIKRDLTEGGIRVPTIASWPGTIMPGSEDDAHWYFGDMMATAAQLAGVQPPINLDSDSFVATLRGQPREKRWSRKSKMYWEFYERGSAQAIRFGKWKAIRKPMFTGEIELYDMSNDAGEKHDYSKRRLDLARHAANLLDKAHEQFETAIKLYPDHHKGYYNLGLIYHRKGDLKRAMEYFQRAVTLNPESIKGHYNLATLYAQQGLLDLAIRHYTKVIELDPDVVEAHYNLGKAYAMQRKLQYAISEWEKVLQLEPRHTAARNNLKKAKRMMDSAGRPKNN